MPDVGRLDTTNHLDVIIPDLFICTLDSLLISKTLLLAFCVDIYSIRLN